ncbi:MAG TPA: cytochrome d ubiquinol oxidase subunit II [Tepidisphaeraceae bacterium]|nr:cytochrome d ubiquinol oxidase subunit II [Tepidisphaeraceae bacterium]
MDLPIIWFILLGILLAGYAILDGFDLGVGILHFVARNDNERRIFINAIGPIWDGNEVWLVTFGGALFAAFPEAYATEFSAFYIPFMILLMTLIFRATAIEFRSKLDSPLWRTCWDTVFCISSTLAALLFGVAAGNAMIGIPLDSRGVFSGSIFDLVGPYPLTVGLLAVAMFAMHGSLYLHLKAPHGELHERIDRWIWHCWGMFLVMYLLTTIYTLVAVPGLVPRLRHTGPAAVLVVLDVLAIANIPRMSFLEKSGRAFASSCLAIAGAVALFSLALWPNLITARDMPANSLTIYRAASSPATLKAMLIIAGIGIPLVLTYTTIIYWVFRHRVEISGHSY